MNYKKAAIALWQIIDHIDSLSDMVKQDDKEYRRLVDQYTKERHNILHTDGYSLFSMNGDIVDFHKGSQIAFDKDYPDDV